LERSTTGGGGDVVDGELALSLIGGAALSLALQKSLAVLVELQLGDDHLRRVDTHIDGRPVNLLPGDPLDVDDPLLAVALDDLALATLVGPTDHLDLVVLANRDRSNVVLVSEVAGEWGAHYDSADTRRRREVGLPAFPPGA